MHSESVESIANAVLYEGYILYPYRPSLKNRQRWTFGGLYPRAYSDAHGGTDAWSTRTECLLCGNDETRISVKIRFLHLISRVAGELTEPWRDHDPSCVEPRFRPVSALQVDGRQISSWQEATERSVTMAPEKISQLPVSRKHVFRFPADHSLERITSQSGRVAGVLARSQEPVEGLFEVRVEMLREGTYKLAVCVQNQSSLAEPHRKSRDEALMKSLVSTHVISHVHNGEFCSMMDPPESVRDLAEGCRNEGLWPVLVGDPGQRDTMLAAPIILYDYPQIAPESPGDLFDATEIDEILTLRILTLTDEEKQQMAGVDVRAHQLLQRTEALVRDQLMSLHGTMRHVPQVGEEDCDA